MIRCEIPRCDEKATTISSRVDAVRDWIYRCNDHQVPQPSVWEPSPLTGRELATELIYAWWPPKHRAVSRKEAAVIVAAWVSHER